MPASFTIATIPATVAEGGSITISVTPSGLTAATSVRWVIVPKGKTPISSADFSSLTGTLDFAANATTAQNITLTPTNDTVLEVGETFELQIYRVVTGGSDALLAGGSGMVTITDNDTGDFGSGSFGADGGANILSAASAQTLAVNGLGGCLPELHAYDAAEKLYRQAIDLQPERPRPYDGLALTLGQTGDVGAI